MSVKTEGPLKDITTDVIHYPVKAKHLNFSSDIYILLSIKYQSFSSKKTIANFPDI